MSGVVLGGVVEVAGSNLARGKIFTASIGSVDSLYPSVYITLENLCTRKAQSSRGGHSRRVEKMCTLLLKKVINFLIFHFWEYFLLIIVSNIYSFVFA